MNNIPIENIIENFLGVMNRKNHWRAQSKENSASSRGM